MLFTRSALLRARGPEPKAKVLHTWLPANSLDCTYGRLLVQRVHSIRLRVLYFGATADHYTALFSIVQLQATSVDCAH